MMWGSCPEMFSVDLSLPLCLRTCRVSEACTRGSGVSEQSPRRGSPLIPVMLIEGALSIAVAIAAYFCLPNWGTWIQAQALTLADL